MVFKGSIVIDGFLGMILEFRVIWNSGILIGKNRSNEWEIVGRLGNEL